MFLIVCMMFLVMVLMFTKLIFDTVDDDDDDWCNMVYAHICIFYL